MRRGINLFYTVLMCGRYRVYIIEDCCGDQSLEVGGQWTVDSGQRALYI